MPTFQHGTATLNYELDGSGPDAVYIPGMGSHSNDLLGQTVRQTLSQNYHLLTVDNRGSGQTVTLADDTSTINDMADDVAAVMAHVGMESARVLGISMGGMIALSLAVYHPHRSTYWLWRWLLLAYRMRLTRLRFNNIRSASPAKLG